MTRVLQTEGEGFFFETNYPLPDIGPTDILVKSVMTGICRSDIDMMKGDFGPLPLNMQGHEGLGQVVTVGDNVDTDLVGKYVATRGEPAYADMYTVRENEYVVVPEASPKYILEPVACGINVVNQAINEIEDRQGEGKKLLILGSGFLAWVAYTHLMKLDLEFDITVVGNANKHLWGETLTNVTGTGYDVIIDLSSRNTIFEEVIYNENSLIIFGAQKEVITDFGGMLWKAVTMVFPSPRNPNFHNCMISAEQMISDGDLDVSDFWTRGYNRTTEWKQAFEDGINRPEGYSRGYLYWPEN